MEEKERYELFGEHCIKDNNPDARCQLLNAYVACVILNEQDKENQQLKQQLAEKDAELWKWSTQYAGAYVHRQNALIAEKVELQQQLARTEKALELAVGQLDDAKDMLIECGKHDWAGMIDTSVDYFKARAREMLENDTSL